MATYKISDLTPIQNKPKDKQQGDPGEPGEPEDGEGAGSPQPGEGKPEDSDGEGQPGEGGTDDDFYDQDPSEGGYGDSEDDDEEGQSVDDIHREIEEKLSKRKDTDGTDAGEDTSADGNKPAPPVNQITKGNSGSLRALDRIPTPKFSWKALIGQFVNTAKSTEPSYAKINKRSITAMAGIAVSGAGAIKPGDKAVDEAFKLAMIFDSSGSMWAKISVSMAETQNLIKQQGSNIAGIIGAGLYGNTVPKFFALDLDSKKFWPVASIVDIHKKAPPGLTQPLANFFRLGGSGGHELPAAGAAAIKTLLGQGYNVVMITDSDITWGDNWINLVDILKTHRSGFFLILDSPTSYQRVVTLLGSAPTNIGHF